METKNAKLFRKHVLYSLKVERGRIKFEQPIENIVRCGFGWGGGEGEGEGEVEGGRGGRSGNHLTSS
jgi:hypothetical protein